MSNDKQKFEPQEAPEKNTDSAFVQVGTDGKPVMPEADVAPQNNEERPKEGTLADR